VTAQLPSLDGVSGLSDQFIWFVHGMRTFLRDHPHLNRLITGEEHSDRMIIWAIVDFLSDFSGTPPFLGYYTLEQLLQQGLSRLCRYGTTIALLESLAMLQDRNRLNYSDGGVSVSVSDRGPQLIQWLTYFQQTYQRDKENVKRAMNIEEILGEEGVHSELWLVQNLVNVTGV